MFSLSGKISDKTRAIFGKDDPAWKPPPDADRTGSPPKGRKVPKGVDGFSTKPNRKQSK